MIFVAFCNIVEIQEVPLINFDFGGTFAVSFRHFDIRSMFGKKMLCFRFQINCLIPTHP